MPWAFSCVRPPARNHAETQLLTGHFRRAAVLMPSVDAATPSHLIQKLDLYGASTMSRFICQASRVLMYTAILMPVAFQPCIAKQTDKPSFEGVWRAEVPAGVSFYQNGWAVARFDKEGAFSMAIVHQRDRDRVERLHFYTGQWKGTGLGATAESLSYFVGQDRYQADPWTFAFDKGTLTDDRGQFTWRRHNPNSEQLPHSLAAWVGRWVGADAPSQRFALALEPTGEAHFRGDRTSIGFQPGGSTTFETVEGNGVFFHIAGRWSIFQDTLVLYDTAYASSELGSGQYASAVILKAVGREELKLRTAVGETLSFEKDNHLPAVSPGESLPPSKRPAHTQLARSADDAALSMLYSGGTAEEFRAWQERFRTKMLDLMGDSSPPAKWSVEQQSRREFDDHVRLELLLHAAGVPSLPVYLLIPQGVTAQHPAPGVLCIHGHGPFGNDAVVGRREIEGAPESIDSHNYDYGIQFVRRGYVVVAPCMTPFGRRVAPDLHRRTDPCAAVFVRMQALGKLLITENLRDLRWALSLLESRSEVSPGRLGSAGLSYGGRMCMMVTAVDPRIRVACISGAWHLLQERVRQRVYTCGGQIIPGILEYGDYPEIGSLIAPRPCVWEVGSHDRGVNREAGEQVTERLQRAYRSLDAGSQLRFDHFEGGHQWSGRVAFPVFDQVLKE